MTNAATTKTLLETTRSDETLYEIVQLDVRTILARRAGQLEIAAAYASLADALRSGQLTLSRYLTSATWGTLFGGRRVSGIEPALG